MIRAFALLVLVALFPAPAAAGPLRLVTYNIRYGAGAVAPHVPRIRIPIPFLDRDPSFGPYNLPLARGVAQLDRIADMLEGLEPDVVLLQEVQSPCAKSLWVDQIAHMADRTGWHHAYHPATSRGPGGMLNTGGNAILSRHPLSEVGAVQLSAGRNAMTARVAVPGVAGGVVVASAHLSTGGGRRQEVDALAAYLAPRRGAIVVGGDFNEEPGGGSLAALVQHFARAGRPLADGAATRGEGPLETFPAIGPTRRIDYLFHGGGLNATRVRVASDVRLSDHLPLIAEYGAPPSPEPGAVPTALLGVGVR
jgi:endonuclease/exonuclease/phosphatase family metal-dependent hydrolase